MKTKLLLCAALVAFGVMSSAPAFGDNVVITGFPGGIKYANGQVSASTTAATLVVANPTRRSVLIRNLDATITVYVGAATVTAANGMPLKAGESVSVDTSQLIQVLAASGTPTVAWFQTYD